MADRPILIVADSRGRLLKDEVNRAFLHLEPRLEWRSGLKIRNTAQFVTPIVRECRPKLIYILNGICDLTTVHSYNPWIVAMQYPTIQQSVSAYMFEVDTLHAALFGLSKELNYSPMIIFTPQTGIDIARYNSFNTGLLHPHQFILNSSILEINQRIVNMNESMRIKTPFISAVIHNRCRRRTRFRYGRLPDGCHPSREMCAIWARKLYENALINTEYYDHYDLINQMY